MKHLKSISFLLLLMLWLSTFVFTACSDDDEANTEINADGVTGTLTDIDGNTYAIVKIGEQWWMAENLKVTTYKNGTAIPNVTDATEWSNLTTGAYASYDNDDSYTTKYGLLYNWYTVNTGNLAPKGWHVPTEAEWDSLSSYVTANPGTSGSVTKALAATTDWKTYTRTGTIGCDLSINNSTGFSALPFGYRSSSNGTYNGNDGTVCLWWMSDEISTSYARVAYMTYNYTEMSIDEYDNKEYGFSVRCVMD